MIYPVILSQVVLPTIAQTGTEMVSFTYQNFLAHTHKIYLRKKKGGGAYTSLFFSLSLQNRGYLSRLHLCPLRFPYTENTGPFYLRHFFYQGRRKFAYLSLSLSLSLSLNSNDLWYVVLTPFFRTHEPSVVLMTVFYHLNHHCCLVLTPVF